MGTLVGLTNFDDVHLDARAVLVPLKRNLFRLRQQRLHASEVEQGVPVVVLLYGARHDVAFAVRKLFVHLTALDVSDELHENLLGGLGRNASKILGGRVPLARDISLKVQLQAPDLNLTGLGVDLDFGVLGRIRAPFVRGEQGVGERDEEFPLVNVLVSRNLTERLKKLKVRHG